MTNPVLAAFRFGYGLPLPQNAPEGPQDMLALLAGPDRAVMDWPGYGSEVVLPLHAQATKARRGLRTVEGARAEYRAAVRAVGRQTTAALRVTVQRSLGSADGFRERLVRFWADHFTTTYKRPETRSLVLAMIEDAIRPNLSGRFADLLQAATLHPSMLIYLDQYLSVGPHSKRGELKKAGLNENLARELIELHTLGVGAGYSQDDVRQMAELLTGVVFRVGEGQAFNPRVAEPGAETVLGTTYDGKGMTPILQALEDLSLRPETGRHLARKLAVHFVSDAPDAGLVAGMEQAYAQSGGDLLAVYRAMLMHPAAWAEAMTKARQPYDFMVAALRGLGIGAGRIEGMRDEVFQRRVLDPMAAMGQPIHGAPGPDGWAEEAEAWITPQGLAARITWGMEMPERMLEVLPEPAELAGRVLGDRVSGPLQFAVGAAENRRDGVGLVFAAPEFNRR